MSNFSIGPLSDSQINDLKQLLSGLTNTQTTWIAGYLAGLTASMNNEQSPAQAATALNMPTIPVFSNLKPAIETLNEVSATATPLTILFGSRTGNGESIAKKLHQKAIENGFSAVLKNMMDYKTRDLKDEKNLLVIVSTHGEGEPPFQAQEIHEFIHGKRAPKLNGVNFSVLAMGDSSYFQFCKTGKDFDTKLEELGATRVFNRIDCDADFDENANLWIEGVLKAFAGSAGVAKQVITITNNTNISPNQQAQIPEPSFNKKNPFLAPVLEKIKLNGRGSEKETLHVELSLDGSGLTYLPGDALGVYPTNDPLTVKELIELTGLDAGIIVQNGFGKKSLYEALFRHYELSVLTTEVISKYATITDNNKLKTLLTDHKALKDYMYGRDVLDLLQEYPYPITVEVLTSMLRKLPPRLYSIASSLDAHPNEVHLTVGVVRYQTQNRHKGGVCSTFLSDRVVENETLPIFIEKNPNFRIPNDPKTPIIMVGPGTGIAPFRSFIEQRELQGEKSKNWLFFGNPHFATDFLYQLEWQKYMKDGILTNLDVAFSRDGNKKVYVQHKMTDKGAELYKWLEEGAHFYVCGDMNRMAADVHKTLIAIVEKHGGHSNDMAQEYVRTMQKQMRYQTDVY